MAKGTAKPLTKSQVAAALGDATGTTKKAASEFLAALADLAYKEAKRGFTIPGIGKLVLAERKARKMIMRFGPKAGQEITVPKKKVLRFRIAKACKDAVLGG